MVYSLYQRPNVAVSKSEGLQPGFVIGMDRNMIRHHHVWVANLFIYQHCLHKIDIAFIRIGFLEVVSMAADVPEMDIENLLP